MYTHALARGSVVVARQDLNFIHKDVQERKGQVVEQGNCMRTRSRIRKEDVGRRARPEILEKNFNSMCVDVFDKIAASN